MSNLIDLFIDNTFIKKRLKRTDHRRRYNTAEMRLMSQISQLISSYCDSLESFTRVLNEWLQQTSMGNSSNFWLAYKVIESAGRVDVWHTTAQGICDRHVCTIEMEVGGQ